jgi:N-acetyl sugar amidotransferase
MPDVSPNLSDAATRATAETVCQPVPYRQCSVSVLDTVDDPAMRFDEQGRCHYYHEYKAAEAEHVFTGEEGARRLAALVETIKDDGKGKPYDCIMGVSGGVDSTYVAYLARQHGLRPLAVHLDNGWNSETAVQNIERICSTLGIELYTHVVNWEEFRDLQLAYIKANVIDVEVPSDHAIFALMYRLAGEKGIRHILSGTNVVTEQVLPPHWIFNKRDHVNLLAIHRAFGRYPLRTYPLFDLKVKKFYQMGKGVTSHSILNLVPYRKAAVKQLIQEKLGWRDYGGKHYESVFTRFYQGHILPVKFRVDKRKAHLSNLIFSGQITKDEALEELARPIYPPDVFARDKAFVLKKLGLSEADFDAYLRAPEVPHTAFPVERSVYDHYPWLRPLRGVANRIKPLLRGA